MKVITKPRVRITKSEHTPYEITVEVTWGDGKVSDLNEFHPDVTCAAHGRDCGFAEDTCRMVKEV